MFKIITTSISDFLPSGYTKAVKLTPVLKAGVIALFLAIPESGLVSPGLSYNIKTKS